MNKSTVCMYEYVLVPISAPVHVCVAKQIKSPVNSLAY